MRHRVISSLILLAAGFCVLALGQAVRAEDDPLRQKALGLNDITGDDPIKAEIKGLLDDKTGTKKLLPVAVKMAKEKDQPFNYNGALILARVAHILKDYPSAEAFYRICVDQAGKLQSGRKLAEGYSGLLEVLFNSKKYDECTKLCREFLEMPQIEDGKDVVLEIFVQALTRQGKTKEANDIVDRLSKLSPDDLSILELKSVVQIESGKYNEAVKTYEEIIDLVNKNDRINKEGKEKLGEHYRYLLSNAYIEAQNIDKAIEVLKKLVTEKPDNPTYNNDLGYVMADHDRELDAAEKMIRKALEEDRKQRKAANPNLKAEDDKDVAAYLDSLGWVLFKKKNYKDAKKFLLEAIKDEEGQHIEIYDHLGDVYMALGEKDEAQKTWERALKLEARTKREQQRKVEVAKKVKNK